ncbi:MAG: signal peptidase I [Eubacterium sp.]|nr:signal peptidase I [Eubacterium sp.]
MRRTVKRKKSHEFRLRKKDKKAEKPSLLRSFANTFMIVFSAIILGYGLIQFCGQTVYMTGPSMESELYDGDVLLVNKLVYKFGRVKRNDIVAIKRIGENNYYDIKRVIALPGDSISVVAGRLVINGKQVSEDLPYSYINSPGVLEDTVKLGDEEYFCIGDNTSNSEDSRYVNFGNVQKSEIKGKIIYRILPKERRGKLGR